MGATDEVDMIGIEVDLCAEVAAAAGIALVSDS